MPPKPTLGTTKKVVKLVQAELKKTADPAKAKDMQGYTKSDMPFYGVMRKPRAVIEKKVYIFLKTERDPMTLPLYHDLVDTLWNLPHREEKYVAIDVAMHYRTCIVIDHLPLYEHMLREEFMWWDLVDPMAVHLIGVLTQQHREMMEVHLQKWIQDDDFMWIRRTAILAQLKHKQNTNQELLFEFCKQRMHEKEFFIRKAVGWVLREYAKTNPEAVKEFLTQNKHDLSGLSYREASRIMIKEGKM